MTNAELDSKLDQKDRIKKLTREFGSKSANIIFISEKRSLTPIAPYVAVAVGEEWISRLSEIKKLGDCKVRSSSPLEDRLGFSFAGLFRTENYEGPLYVDSVLRSAKTGRVQKYKERYSISGSDDMALLFHKTVEGITWHILRHPHRTNVLIVQSDLSDDDYVYNCEVEKLYNSRSMGNNLVRNLVECSDCALDEAIAHYLDIEKLYSGKNTYHMECKLSPFSLLQWRPAFKITTANWVHEKSNTDFCMGISDKEGFDAPVFVFDGKVGLDKAALDDFNNSRIKSCSEQGVVYVEKLDNYLLNYGVPLDFMFDKSCTLITDSYSGILRHDGLRSMQHFKHLMVGTKLYVKTGDVLRVRTDGCYGSVKSIN